MDTYTVTYIINGDVQWKTFASEREAVRLIGHLDRSENTSVIDYTKNIDRSKYRY